MPRLEDQPIKSGVMTLKGGATYTCSSTIKVQGKLRVYVDGTTATIDGNPMTAVEAWPKIFSVGHGDDLKISRVNWIIPDKVRAVDMLGGKCEVIGGYGLSGPLSTCTGGGAILIAKQCERARLSGYNYKGRPHGYVAFFGDPMQEKFGNTGIAADIGVEDVWVLEAPRNEAAIRAMRGYGYIRRVRLDSRLADTTKDPQCIQPRGSNLVISESELFGSISSGPLSPPADDPIHTKLPHGNCHVSNCKIIGYAQNNDGMSIAYANCEVLDKDPRGGSSTWATKKATEHPGKNEMVVCGIKIVKGFTTLAGAGVIKDDTTKAFDIFGRANAAYVP
jgi:hypothetical protein